MKARDGNVVKEKKEKIGGKLFLSVASEECLSGTYVFIRGSSDNPIVRTPY